MGEELLLRLRAADKREGFLEKEKLPNIPKKQGVQVKTEIKHARHLRKCARFGIAEVWVESGRGSEGTGWRSRKGQIKRGLVCHAEGVSLVPEGEGQLQRDSSRRQSEDPCGRVIKMSGGVMILKTKRPAKGPKNQPGGGMARIRSKAVAP